MPSTPEASGRTATNASLLAGILARAEPTCRGKFGLQGRPQGSGKFPAALRCVLSVASACMVGAPRNSLNFATMKSGFLVSHSHIVHEAHPRDCNSERSCVRTKRAFQDIWRKSHRQRAYPCVRGRGPRNHNPTAGLFNLAASTQGEARRATTGRAVQRRSRAVVAYYNPVTLWTHTGGNRATPRRKPSELAALACPRSNKRTKRATAARSCGHLKFASRVGRK